MPHLLHQHHDADNELLLDWEALATDEDLCVCSVQEIGEQRKKVGGQLERALESEKDHGGCARRLGRMVDCLAEIVELPKAQTLAWTDASSQRTREILP